MLFYVGQTSTSPATFLPSSFDHYIFSETSANTNFQSSFALIKHHHLLNSLFASLKNKQSVIITPAPHNLILPDNLDKQRLYISPGQFIFLAPRATYFFNQLSANINISCYLDMEKLAISWGK